MPLNEEQKKKLEQLRAKFTDRDIELVVSAGKEYFIGSPSRVQWHSFREASLDPKRRRNAMENLAKACAIEPNAEELDKLFARKPALAETLAINAGKLAGLDDEAEMASFGEG